MQEPSLARERARIETNASEDVAYRDESLARERARIETADTMASAF